MPHAQLSDAYGLFALKYQPLGQVKLSGYDAQVVIKLDRASIEVGISHIYTRTLGTPPLNPDNRLTDFDAHYLLRMTPDFRWIDMFKDIVFPHDISEGSEGATRFNTQVNEVSSGHDQRLSLWDFPKMEYNIAYGVRTMEDLHDLIRFFRAVRGKLHSFRFFDNIDHSSSFATYEEARQTDDITPFDQQIGVGDDNTTSFQLVKHYDFETETSTRPIFKPIPDTVLLSVDDEIVTWFSCDTSVGVVTIHTRLDAPGITHALLAQTDGGTHKWRLTVPTYVPDNPATLLVNEQVNQPLPIILPGEWFSVTGAGLAHPIVYGVCITSTETQLDFTWVSGVSPGDANADFTAHITTYNTPRPGQIVKAGFQFHVPVRFDTDRLPVKLEYYGVGSAEEITLVEVRPDEE